MAAMLEVLGPRVKLAQRAALFPGLVGRAVAVPVEGSPLLLSVKESFNQTFCARVHLQRVASLAADS